jgi:hypothetical protein
MATTKKSTGKRSSSTAKTTKKAAPRKKTTTRSAATKRAATTRSRKSTSRASKAAELQSFRVVKQQEPFLSFKVTVQTLYWLILAGAVLLLGLWVLNIHNRVQMIYDEIDQSQMLQQELDAKELEMAREKAKKDK